MRETLWTRASDATVSPLAWARRIASACSVSSFGLAPPSEPPLADQLPFGLGPFVFKRDLVLCDVSENAHDHPTTVGAGVQAVGKRPDDDSLVVKVLDVSNESSHTAGQGGFLRRLLATVVRQLVCANGRAPVGVTGAASAYRG